MNPYEIFELLRPVLMRMGGITRLYVEPGSEFRKPGVSCELTCPDGATIELEIDIKEVATDADQP